MPPPELAGDGPVAVLLHPGVVGLGPTPGDDLDLARAHRLDSGLSEGLDAHVPLLGDEWLHHRLAAIADAHRVTIGLDVVDEPKRLHVLDDALAALEAVHARVLPRRRRHLAVKADHSADRQVVALADLEVGRVGP